MLMVISPAKNLDETAVERKLVATQYEFENDSQVLIDKLKTLNELDLMELMKISSKLANLNLDRYNAWQLPFDESNAKQAAMLFKGDVYQGLDAPNLTDDDLAFAQNHLRILSGLYGLLRPLDLMQPYRLEMGTKFKNERGNNLYQFWGEKITNKLNENLSSLNSQVLVNLASIEYFKAVKPKNLKAIIVTPIFKDWKNGQYKIISFYAKKARGLMANYAIKNRITDVEDLKLFDSAGYGFSAEMSKENEWVFTRRLEV